MFQDAVNPTKEADPVSNKRGRELHCTPMASSTSNSGYSATQFKQQSIPATSNANPRKASYITSTNSGVPLKTEASANDKTSSWDDGESKEFPNGDSVFRIEKINLESRQGTTPILGWALATNGQKKCSDGRRNL
jgi:hypothetical protein